MNIAFITNVVYPFVTGGAQKRVYEIGTRLATEGHDVTIYGRHFWDGPDEMLYDGMRLRAVAPEATLYAKDGRRSITEAIDFSARLLPRLGKDIGDFDVVVASVFPYFPVLSARICASLSDVPLVTTWHEVWEDYWDEYLGRLSPGGKIVERITTTIPQYPVAVSGVTADRLTRIGPDRQDVSVVPNGINIEQIESAQLPDSSNRADGEPGFNILFAGRLITDKNVDTLLAAFDRLADTQNATLGIIGEGPEEHTLQKQAANLDHSSRVTFLGFLEEYETVLGHMKAADVFVSPSTREGFGITFAEAMAADCTVIAADHPDSAADEVLSEAGFLVEPSVEAVATKLESALAGERPREDPTKRAKRFSWANIASEAEQVYEQAARRRENLSGIESDSRLSYDYR